MGGGQSKKEHVIDNGWESMSKGQFYNIVRDRNGRHGNEYTYVLDNRYSPENQFNIYQQRRTSTAPIVKAYASENHTDGSTLVPQNKFRVITERIKKTLSEIPQITYPETLYVLDRSLNGYSLLYNKAGPFNVNSDMIGFTQEGQARVWLNENFGVNHPSHQKRVLQSTSGDQTHSIAGNRYAVSSDQAAMVRNIVNVVQRKCQKGLYPQPFKSKIEGSKIGFKQAQDIIQNTMIEENLIRFNSIDLIKNTIKVKKWRNSQGVINHPIDHHYISHNQMIGGHYISNQQPIVQEIVTNYGTRPEAWSNAHYISSNTAYRPMPTAKTTNLKFNYMQPKQLFHPNIYAQKY